jgi:protein-tyrosine-phosphatase/predicted ATP-grasp superfamily ATP-dependent carboligase
VLGDEPRIVVPAARSLWRQGIPVSVGGSGTNLLALQSRAIRKFHRLMVEGEAESVMDCLQKIIDTEQPDWLLPTSDCALLFVANHYARLNPLIKLACPDAATILTVLDKESTIDAAVRCGIVVPRTHKIQTLSQLHEEREDLRFPLIAKPRSKQPGDSFKLRYYRDWPELEREFQRDSDFGRKYMLQEYEPGEGVGIEVLMADGCPQVLFAHRRLQEYPSTGGVSVVASSEELYPELVQSSLALLREIGWEGLAMVEYRYDPDTKRATLMEVNGRLWGSVGLSIAAGIDFPFAAWELAHGHKVAPACYQAGIRARWTAGVILRLHELFVNPRSDGMPRPSTLSELFSAAKMFLPGTNDMLWVWDDPFPAIFELLLIGGRLSGQTVKSLIRSILPKAMLARLRTWRSLEQGTREIYLRSQLHRMLSPWRPRLPAQVRSALCVCHGNIIRSPFASVQLARVGLRAVSAGLDTRPGRGADERAIRIAPEFGVSLAEHAACALTKAMIEDADVVFVMDGVNEARVLALYPQARKKLLLLGRFTPQRLVADEIPDPYNSDDNAIRKCYEVISCCVTQVSSSLGLAENSGRVGRT